MEKIKICFTASSGGHLEEISQLKNIAKRYTNFLITENVEKIEENKNIFEKEYLLPQINRKEFLFFIKFIYIFIKAFFILKREKPNYIISTGALCTYPICLIGKVIGAKIIYVESFARCETLSLTGKLMKNVADMFIVQWDTVLKCFPNAIYGGGIF